MGVGDVSTADSLWILIVCLVHAINIPFEVVI